MAKDLSSRDVPTGRNQVKEESPRRFSSFNNFPAMSHKHLSSHRYGDISPFFYFYGTRGDKVPLITKQDIGTFTLQSPIESDIYCNRTYIKVNHEALYPINWELMRTIKQDGEDVPEHMRMELNFSYVAGIFANMGQNALSNLNELNPLTDASAGEFFTSLLYSVLSTELLLSQGSLFSMFNIHVTNCNAFDYIYGQYDNFDKWFDSFFVPKFIDIVKVYRLFGVNIEFSPDYNRTYYIDSDGSLGSANIKDNKVSFRYALELMRNHPFTIQVFGTVEEGVRDSVSEFASSLSEYFNYYDHSTMPYFDSNTVNVEIVGAYQLACAHFFTDDRIDSVYTSDLWFDAFMTQAEAITPQLENFRYTMNGIKHRYDFFNGVYLQKLFEGMVNEVPSSIDEHKICWNIMRMLFGFRKSLKFGDYFTSARANLLSGNPDDEYAAIVNNNAVSAVNIARSVQYTRLRHNVNLVGSRLSDYLPGIFGGKKLDAKRDIPQWLAQQSFKVKGYEVENTSSAQAEGSQNIITTILKTSHQKFSFKTYVDDQCIILGLQTYDVDRIYSESVDRHALHFDRFDDFLPPLQFVGDQEIGRTELNGVGNTANIPFAYTGRYQEYKKAVSYASGAYISNLPSYAFITDNREGVPYQGFIDSDFIRSSNAEFDRFFASLSGYSLSSYFHFRVKSVHDLTELTRNMVKHPQILK